MKHKIFLLAISIFVVLNLFATAPAITSFSPSSGAVGTLVTITGTNLSSPTAFTIGGTAAIVVSNNGTMLVGTGSVGASNQGVSVAVSADGNTAIAGGWMYGINAVINNKTKNCSFKSMVPATLQSGAVILSQTMNIYSK